MNKISAISVLHNEEKYLERAFTELKPYVDEFVVIDQESTDATVEIAKKFTDKILLLPRVYYPAAHYHEAQLMAKNEWVVGCAPDELWSKEALKLLPRLARSRGDAFRFRCLNGRECKTWIFKMWKRLKVIWTDSLNTVPCNLDNLVVRDVPGKFVISNLRTRQQGLDGYRVEACRRLLVRYGDMKVEPYAGLCKYYKEILEGTSV